MKISSDLRAAVRSAEKSQPAKSNHGWQAKRDANLRAVEKLRNHPKHKKRIANALTRVDYALHILAEADKTFEVLGLSRTNGGTGTRLEIGDDEKFVAAGGDLAPEPEVAWRFDAVMARLAAAPSEEAGWAILKEYGINWS